MEIFEKCRACRKNGKIDAELPTVAEHLTEVNGAVFDVANRFAGCIPGLHYALKKQGLMTSLHCLNPNEVLLNGQAEKIDRLWTCYPEIADDDFVKEFLSKENNA